MSKALWELVTRELSLAVGWTDAWKGGAGCQLNDVGSRASTESEPCVNASMATARDALQCFSCSTAFRT